jgi:hypothetical protein
MPDQADALPTGMAPFPNRAGATVRERHVTSMRTWPRARQRAQERCSPSVSSSVQRVG